MPRVIYITYTTTVSGFDNTYIIFPRSCGPCALGIRGGSRGWALGAEAPPPSILGFT